MVVGTPPARMPLGDARAGEGSRVRSVPRTLTSRYPWHVRVLAAPPAIALVRPSGSGTVPLDPPAVAFCFARGEPGDPLDARSFSIAVGGRDRTAARGPIAEPDAAALTATRQSHAK